MASSVSTILKLEIMADGENENTWGLIANRNFEVLERAGAGHFALAIAGATTTLTATASVLGDWHYHSFKCTGTLTTNSSVIVPNQSRVYLFENATTGSFTLTVKTAAGTGVVIPTGQRAVLTCDATNVSGVVLHPYDATAYLPLTGGTLTGNLIVSKASFPQWVLLDSDAAADAKRWAGWIDNTTGSLYVGPQTDAGSGSVSIKVARTGIATFVEQVQGPAGTVGAPAFSFSTDINSGLRSGGADIAAIVTGGADRVSVDSTGNVFIGATVAATVAEVRVHHLKGPNSGNGYASYIVEGGTTTKTGIFQISGANGNVDVGTQSTNTTGTLSLYAGGSARLIIDTAGNAGAGMSPVVVADHRISIMKGPATGDGYSAFRLEGGTTTKQATFQIGNSNGDVVVGTNSGNTTGSLSLFSGGAVAAVFSAAGDLGVGQLPILNSGYKTMTLGGTDGGAIELTNSSSMKGRLFYESATDNLYLANHTADGEIIFSSGTSTARMYLMSSGDFRVGQLASGSPGIGNTTTGFCFTQAGRFFGSAAQGSAFNLNVDGTVLSFARSGVLVGGVSVTTTTTTYATSSDYRLKENVVPLTGALDRLALLQPKRFNFKADPDGPQVDGFLAHEVQDIVPEAVTGEMDGVDFGGNPIMQGIDQSKLIPLLVAAVQQLAARVTALETP